jgi:HAE1 family hydrophobic/amphiphilic exporter-1
MSISELSVRRPVFATMLVSFVVVLGLFSFADLGVDLFPKADPATVSVSVQLPGASPQEMTSVVVEPLEEALAGLSGIDDISARVTEGTAQITVKFVLERDIDEAANDVREKVARAMRRVPPQVLTPVIQKSDPDSDPVMTIVLSSKVLSLRALTEVADKQIRRAIESADGVGQVDLSGGRAREIHIVVDVDRLNAFGLSIEHVREAIARENLDIPGGTIEQGKAQLLLRTPGRFEAAAQFQDIVITTVNGTPVKVADVASVEDAAEQPRSAAWMDQGGPAVMLDIRRASGQNTIRVIEGVKAKLAAVRKSLPRGVSLVVTKDESRFIYASIAALEEHLIWGSILAAVVVMLFIRNIRAVLISALAIPASIIATFTLMRAMDFTLNNMTLLALTLSVGIVIDDAIVVLENVFRHIEETGMRPFEAAIRGTREVGLAVMATTFSMVIIFVPVAFMTGFARRFIYPFAVTMAFAILVSMAVSFTLTPMLSSRFLKVPRGGGHTKKQRLFSRIESWYAATLEWSLRHPAAVLATGAVCMLAAFPLNRMVGRTFIPNEDMGEFVIHIDSAEGTSLDGMSEFAQAMAARIRHIEGIAQTQPTISGRVNHSHLLVQLKPIEERSVTQDEVVARVRAVLADFPGAQPVVTTRTALGGGETGAFPINVNLVGPDMDTLSDYGLKLLAKAQQAPGLTDAKVTVYNSNPEIRVAVDRERAADLGVRVSTVGSALRLMVAGEDEVSAFRDGTEQYPVKIRVRAEQRSDPAAIARLTVPSPNGPVRIDSVARLERGFGPTQVQRSNRQFTITFTADLVPGYALDAAAADVRRLIQGLKMPPDYGFRLSGQSRILDQTTTSLMMAMGIACIFVYMVLAAQFESFLQPVAIMLALPLSVPFALLTLWATGHTLNLWSALGVLLLLGVVKKNSILQVDYANTLRAQGMPLRRAIVEASRTRLRPILMTTSAIVAGLIPTALGLGIGGAQRSAIAVTIIGGQSLCLFLTLLLVPVAYELLDRFEQSVLSERVSWLGRLSTLLPRRLRAAD